MSPKCLINGILIVTNIVGRIQCLWSLFLSTLVLNQSFIYIFMGEEKSEIQFTIKELCSFVGGFLLLFLAFVCVIVVVVWGLWLVVFFAFPPKLGGKRLLYCLYIVSFT